MANGIRTGNPVDSIKDVIRSSMKVSKFDIHLKKVGGNISQNIVEITIKMETIVRKPLMIKITNTHPLCSPDLEPSDFYLFRYLQKKNVCVCSLIFILFFHVTFKTLDVWNMSLQHAFKIISDSTQYIYIYIYTRSIREFPDFFCMGTFIDSAHMKL